MFINQNFDATNLSNIYTVQKHTVQNESWNLYFSTDLFPQRKIIKQFFNFFYIFCKRLQWAFFVFPGCLA